MPIEPKCCSISASDVLEDIPETKIVSSWTMKSPLRSLGGPPPKQKINWINKLQGGTNINKIEKPRLSDISVNH